MLNRMNKRMGQTFNLRSLHSVEAKEHGRNMSTAELLTAERKEHGLKKTPTLSQAMRAEYVEHKGAGHSKATEIYGGT
jgi:hypothetical protein